MAWVQRYSFSENRVGSRAKPEYRGGSKRENSLGIKGTKSPSGIEEKQSLPMEIAMMEKQKEFKLLRVEAQCNRLSSCSFVNVKQIRLMQESDNIHESVDDTNGLAFVVGANDNQHFVQGEVNCVRKQDGLLFNQARGDGLRNCCNRDRAIKVILRPCIMGLKEHWLERVLRIVNAWFGVHVYSGFDRKEVKELCHGYAKRIKGPKLLVRSGMDYRKFITWLEINFLVNWSQKNFGSELLEQTYRFSRVLKWTRDDALMLREHNIQSEKWEKGKGLMVAFIHLEDKVRLLWGSKDIHERLSMRVNLPIDYHIDWRQLVKLEEFCNLQHDAHILLDHYLGVDDTCDGVKTRKEASADKEENSHMMEFNSNKDCYIGHEVLQIYAIIYCLTIRSSLLETFLIATTTRQKSNLSILLFGTYGDQKLLQLESELIVEKLAMVGQASFDVATTWLLDDLQTQEIRKSCDKEIKTSGLSSNHVNFSGDDKKIVISFNEAPFPWMGLHVKIESSCSGNHHIRYIMLKASMSEHNQDGLSSWCLTLNGSIAITDEKKNGAEEKSYLKLGLGITSMSTKVLMAMKTQGGEEAVLQILNRTRELYKRRIQETTSMDQLASIFAECAITEAEPIKHESTSKYLLFGTKEKVTADAHGISILEKTGRSQIMLDAFAEGSSFICLQCGGLVSIHRRDEHYAYWCSNM